MNVTWRGEVYPLDLEDRQHIALMEVISRYNEHEERHREESRAALGDNCDEKLAASVAMLYLMGSMDGLCVAILAMLRANGLPVPEGVPCTRRPAVATH